MRALLAGAMICAAGIVTAQASSSIVTFSVDMATNVLLGSFNPGSDFVNVRGTFDGWSAGGVTLAQQGSSTIYTNTVDDTSDANGGAMQYIFVINNTTYETLPTHINGANNRQVLLPTSSGASLVLPTCFFADAGAIVTSNVKFQVDMAEQIVLGNFNKTTSTNVNIRGTILGNFGDPTSLAPLYTLTNDPTIVTTDNLGVQHSNVYVGTWPVTNSPGAFVEFKFTYTTAGNTSWDSPQSPNSDGGGNRYFANVSQTLPIVLFNDQGAAFPCTNVFSVDMSGPAGLDAGYDPTTVRVTGGFNGWADVAMTNDPSAANPNIFTTSVIIGQGSSYQYQYRYNSAGSTVYDHLNGATGGQGNRVQTEPNLPNYSIPTVYFNDASYNDYLLAPVSVTFTIDMTGAVGTDTTPWAPGAAVFVNGPWPNWLAWTPIELAGQQLTEAGSTPIYTGTFSIPKGIVTSLTYKYSLGGGDNEAAQDNNHARVIRTTATGAYSFAQDKFGNQYVEPSFGQLMVVSASAGNVPLSWLGRPGCEVQIRSGSLNSGSWLSLPLTDGTNWTAGTYSTNGLVSQTNWPASNGNVFFRLIKQ